MNNIYSDLFIRILNISLISCYTIVVVMVLRALILRWERKYAYFLWFVVLVNLCIPFRISGPFSLVPAWIADFDIADKSGGLIKTEDKTVYLPDEQIVHVEASSISSHNYTADDTGGIPGTDSNSETEFIQGGLEEKTDYLPNEQIVVTHSIGDHDDRSDTGEGVPGTDSNHETTYHAYTDNIMNQSRVKHIMALVWGFGVILLVMGNAWTVWQLQRKLKDAEPFAAAPNDGEYADKVIRTADGIETPFLWGLCSPVIYLPRTIGEEESSYVIAHECCHRKRKDHIFKPLFFMIAVIHWFNPLVWAAYFLFVRDMEISCDEAVIANADGDIRKKYAESLLKYAARQNGYTLTPITFGEPSLRCRIESVLQYKERDRTLSAIILAVVIVVMAGLVVKPHISSGLENAQITDSLPDASASVPADKSAGHREAEDNPAATASQMKASWEPGLVEGIDGENQYTQILLGSEIMSGGAIDFLTFSYSGESETEKRRDRNAAARDDTDGIAYVMAGEMKDQAITGSLWLVEADSKTVHPIAQNITMQDTQASSILFEDTTYIMLNYLSGDRTDGRILPMTKNALSTEIMADLSGEKTMGDTDGTILCDGYAYWLIDAETVREVNDQQ